MAVNNSEVMRKLRITVNIACLLVAIYFTFQTLVYINEQYADLGRYDSKTDSAIRLGGLHAIANWVLILCGSFTACSYGWFRVSITYRAFLAVVVTLIAIGTCKSMEHKEAYYGRVIYMNYITFWAFLLATVGPHLLLGRGYASIIRNRLSTGSGNMSGS